MSSGWRFVSRSVTSDCEFLKPFCASALERSTGSINVWWQTCSGPEVVWADVQSCAGQCRCSVVASLGVAGCQASLFQPPSPSFETDLIPHVGKATSLHSTSQPIPHAICLARCRKPPSPACRDLSHDRPKIAGRQWTHTAQALPTPGWTNYGRLSIRANRATSTSQASRRACGSWIIVRADTLRTGFVAKSIL